MTNKRRKRYDDKLHLDMGFAEAMERFAGVKPAEMQANIRKAKKKKPPGGKKRNAPSGDASGHNVVRLGDRRKSHHG